MSDNFKSCEACSQTFDDSCGREDSQSGLWFCDGCLERMGGRPFSESEGAFETIDYAANYLTPPSYFGDRI